MFARTCARALAHTHTHKHEGGHKNTEEGTHTNTDMQATGHENIHNTYISQKTYSPILKFQNSQLKTASEIGDKVEETQNRSVSDKHTGVSFIYYR